MAWGNGGGFGGGRRGFAKTDKFGQPYRNVACKPNKRGFMTGYVDLGGSTYKIEPGDNKGDVQFVRITKVQNSNRGQRL